MNLFKKKPSFLHESAIDTMESILSKLLTVSGQLDRNKALLIEKQDELAKERERLGAQVGELQSEIDRIDSFKSSLTTMSDSASKFKEK